MQQTATYQSYPDENYEGLFFTDTDGETWAILRSLTFDDQDRRLGQDTYALTYMMVGWSRGA